MSTSASQERAAALLTTPLLKTPRPTARLATTPLAVRPGPLHIDRHLNGPRRAANGGFAAGAIASRVDSDTVTVVLRRPVRLGVPLEVSEDASELVVRDRDHVVAVARAGALEPLEPPHPPTLDEARRARDAHPFIGGRHALSDCVVCGPARTDGMHVTPGPVPARPDLLAAPWTVGTRYAHAGIADFPAVWAALDCPSYPAVALQERVMSVLGTMTARVDRRPRVGEELVVYGWTRGRHGRRFETSAAIVDASGAVIARADSTWIAVKHQRLVSLLGHLV